MTPEELAKCWHDLDEAIARHVSLGVDRAVCMNWIDVYGAKIRALFDAKNKRINELERLINGQSGKDAAIRDLLTQMRLVHHGMCYGPCETKDAIDAGVAALRPETLPCSRCNKPDCARREGLANFTVCDECWAKEGA